MLSKGQIIFAILFFCAFVFFIAKSYKKDKKLHNKQYKGSIWILIGFIVFIVLLTILKYSIKHN